MDVSILIATTEKTDLLKKDDDAINIARRK